MVSRGIRARKALSPFYFYWISDTINSIKVHYLFLKMQVVLGSFSEAKVYKNWKNINAGSFRQEFWLQVQPRLLPGAWCFKVLRVIATDRPEFWCLLKCYQSQHFRVCLLRGQRRTERGYPSVTWGNWAPGHPGPWLSGLTWQHLERFLTLLILGPFNTVPCSVVTPNHKTVFLLSHNYSFATITNLNVNISDMWPPGGGRSSSN